MSGVDREQWPVLGPLLDRALDLEDEERASWLADLRSRSPALADELVSLLSGESAADREGFLTQSLQVGLAGVVLGGYTLERPLGQGGMGSVWLAHRSDGRYEGRAAVKLLNLALLSPTGQARFRREGSVLARLSHPAIAGLLDAGVSATGQPYLVIEYVDGEPIDHYVARVQPPLEVRIRLVLEVLSAVGHAHANLIVHRDLKSSNILVTRDGAVKLLDFGIAKLLDEGADGTVQTLTADGTLALTPECAAPEQAADGVVTTATDVYAVGVLLYVLVSGRHPTAQGRTRPADVLRALIEVRPEPLGHGDLDTIVDRALRKDPRERYQTVGAFADDLERFLRHEPVSARRDTVGYRTRKFVRRHRVAVVGGALAAAALVASVAATLSEAREATRQRDAALLARRRADAQVEFQSLLMSQADERPVTMRQILDRGRRALELQYGGDRRVLASILSQLSTRYAELGDNAVRGELLARAESIAVAEGDGTQLAEVRCNMADKLRVDGRYDDARGMLDRVDAALKESPDAGVEALCLTARAQLQLERGDASSSGPALRRAIAIRDSLGDTTGTRYVDLLSLLAYSLDQEHRYRESVATFRRASAIVDAGGRAETMAAAILQHDMAVTLITLGETADAERILHEVLVRVARSDPTGHLPPQPVIHYAHTALFDGHADSAAAYFARLADQSAAEKNRYWEGRALFGLVQAELDRGRVTQARRALARFHPLANDPKLASTDDQIVDERFLTARLAAAGGDSAVAHGLAVDVLRAHGYLEGKRRRVMRSAIILAAETALATGDAAGALSFARDARTIAARDTLAEQRSGYVGEARLVEARALLAEGDSAAARSALRAAMAALRSGAGPDHPRVREGDRLAASLGG